MLGFVMPIRANLGEVNPRAKYVAVYCGAPFGVCTGKALIESGIDIFAGNMVSNGKTAFVESILIFRNVFVEVENKIIVVVHDECYYIWYNGTGVCGDVGYNAVHRNLGDLLRAGDKYSYSDFRKLVKKCVGR